MSVATLHERSKPTRALDCLLLTFLDAGRQNRKARTKFMEKQVRRVVTNHEADGKVVVLLDGAPGTIAERPESGVKSWLLWVTDFSAGRCQRIAGSRRPQDQHSTAAGRQRFPDR